MSTVFALVHGSNLGGWAWERLVPELRALGHEAVPVDLPCSDESYDTSGYARVVADATRDAGDDLVLVGHSLGGLTIPLVPALRPVRSLVFLAALIAQPGVSFVEQEAADPTMVLPRVDDRNRLYCCASDEDAQWALSRMRPQAQTPHRERCPLTQWPDVPSAYVVATEDRAIAPEWGRRAARERLGVEAVEFPGADHSPFVCKPAELARLLIEVAHP